MAIDMARLKATYEKYERFLPAATFLAGTLWDIVTLGRIDQTSNLVQLGGYALIVLVFLGLEIRDTHEPFVLDGRPRLQKAWRYRDEVTHFCLGSLLSAFTIFYFKSASLVGSLLFFLIIAGCLVGNEFSAMRRMGLVMRTGLYALCVTSLLFCITPVWFGRVGWLPFLTALTVSGAYWGLVVYGASRGIKDWDFLRKRVAAPYAGVLLAFFFFYLLRIIPPVPLSLMHVGIYHDIEKVKGGYIARYTRPDWKIWQRGDQSFGARPGDQLYVFFSVFSPTGFRDTLRVRWLYRDDQKGWTPSDTVSVGVTGGREEGYRGFAKKTHFQPGDWQVRIETSDEREIGRITLTVEPEAAETPREVKTLTL